MRWVFDVANKMKRSITSTYIVREIFVPIFEHKIMYPLHNVKSTLRVARLSVNIR